MTQSVNLVPEPVRRAGNESVWERGIPLLHDHSATLRPNKSTWSLKAAQRNFCSFSPQRDTQLSQEKTPELPRLAEKRCFLDAIKQSLKWDRKQRTLRYLKIMCFVHAGCEHLHRTYSINMSFKEKANTRQIHHRVLADVWSSSCENCTAPGFRWCTSPNT